MILEKNDWLISQFGTFLNGESQNVINSPLYSFSCNIIPIQLQFVSKTPVLQIIFDGGKVVDRGLSAKGPDTGTDFPQGKWGKGPGP